ncbi:MAG: hypothetical protein QXZ70_04650 [Candidatus Bathyarchaeia archaeon]
MNYKKYLLVSLIFLIYLILAIFPCVYSNFGNPEYTYYGVVPSKIFRYVLIDANNLTSGWRIGFDNTTLMTGSPGYNDMLIATKSLLVIVAAENDTNVEVYNLTTGDLILKSHINSLEKKFVLLTNGTFFKVVSDKHVSVLLLNYQYFPPDDVSEGPTPQTFYTSTDGLYVGKEFVFMASEYQAGSFYRILALEKSTVTVTREDGEKSTISLEANAFKSIMLLPFKVYKIESTGNIMIQSGIIAGTGGDSCPCNLVPSAEGGFMGRFFYVISSKSWGSSKEYGYRIMTIEDTHVKVYDLETKQLINEFSISGGNGVGFHPLANAICVQSDKPITLSYINNGSLGRIGGPGNYGGYANGIMFMGIQPYQDTPIFLPTDAFVEAYFFAKEETQLIIDSDYLTIEPNSVFVYTAIGPHIVWSDKDVILQINFWPFEPQFQGLWFTGAAIPCIETVNVKPNVTLTPIVESFPMIYIYIGVGVVAIAIIIGLLLIRRHSGVSI